jgi:hypothetical protein
MAKGLFSGLKGMDAFGKVRYLLRFVSDLGFMPACRRRTMLKLKLGWAPSVRPSFFLEQVVSSDHITVTILSAAIILAFTTMEFFDYRRVNTDTSIVVDTSRGEKLTVSLNVTFPRVPCYRMLPALHDTDTYLTRVCVCGSSQS